MTDNNVKQEKTDTRECSETIINNFNNILGKNSDFYKHMNNSRIEFFKGIRSVMDKTLESIEKSGLIKK